ncbi:sialoadhesin-like [Rana temporaria]|uniref:sialoadhesin-like n=1 Tax=Rana temporaria TaxID=8407 RepID=UPI001AAC4D01|nr:sialoadhesin-like [Rana temporaria]
MDITRKILLLTLFQGLVCQRWEFPTRIDGLVGTCVEIPCTFYPRENSGTSNTVWYLFNRRDYPQIFNSLRNSSVLMNYRSRTSLVPGKNTCSLRIDPVIRNDGDHYYPGIAEDQDTNAWTQQRHKTLKLYARDTPNIPDLIGNGEMVEGRPENVSCSVEHTCGSSPPSLRFNKAGQTARRSKDLSEGKWKEILTITYIPSYEDDKTQFQCTATYHNGRTSQNAVTLNIRYAPRDVTVSSLKNKAVLEGSDVTVTCSSRSNPTPHTYEWYRGNNKIKLGSQDQKIKVQNVSKGTEPYTCVAINIIGSGDSLPTEITDEYSSADRSTGNKYSSILFLILGILAGVVLLIVIVYCYTRIKACQTSSRPEIICADLRRMCSGLTSLASRFGPWRLALCPLISTNPAQNSQQADGTYTDLVKTEVSSDYDTLKSPQQPDGTYADLVKTEVSSDYDTLKSSFPAHPADGGRDLH